MDHLERGPALANAVVVLGFVVLMTVFLTDSPWSVIIGVGTVVAAGLWAGLADGHPGSGTPASESPVSTTLTTDQPADERDHGHTT
ncbi:hypothetical protein [Euzebya tangerina]|uniref:hypothetical protein n=1 Tax=Euzebya tangerina TaxID=591198 RepID=UPI000E31D419|nr:hypothetical protein [Euzebya tangerina]